MSTGLSSFQSMRFDIASILAWDTGLSLQKKKKKKQGTIN
jgi:hypothetical protein